jgi:hypothetical protein
MKSPTPKKRKAKPVIGRPKKRPTITRSVRTTPQGWRWLQKQAKTAGHTSVGQWAEAMTNTSPTGFSTWLPGLPTELGTYLYKAPTQTDIPRLALVDVVRHKGELLEDCGEGEYMTLTSYKPGKWAGPLK